jgi:di/tricarboxylate transporter
LCRDETGLLLIGPPKEQMEFPSSNAELVEVVVPPRSSAIGKTMRELKLRNRTGLTGVALWRHGRAFRTDARDRALQEGDGLLLFGACERTRNFDPAPDFLWLQPPPADVPPPESRRQAPIAVAILIMVVVVAAFDWLSIAVTALAGAAAMVVLGILTARQAYAAVDWRTIALIGGMYPMGKALQNSGTMDLFSEFLTSDVGGLGPRGALLTLALLAIALTQPLHSSVVAVILTPLALGVSQALGANPIPFALSVMVGASASYLMPVGHPAPLLVETPGQYRAADYLRFGLGPVLIVFAVIAFLIPLIWPL